MEDTDSTSPTPDIILNNLFMHLSALNLQYRMKDKTLLGFEATLYESVCHALQIYATLHRHNYKMLDKGIQEAANEILAQMINTHYSEQGSVNADDEDDGEEGNEYAKIPVH